MPLFSKRKMLDGKKIVPMPRGRSDSLFRKLERRQMIVESRDGHTIEPIMEVFNPLIEFKDMPKADIIKYEEVFHEFDADGNGMLTLEEIKAAMRKLGTFMTHMEFKDLINELDTDGDKMLDLREFICIYQKLNAGTASNNLTKFVDEVEVGKVGVGGARSFFEDKAARTKETSYETEIRLEKEESERKRKEEEQKRMKMASKASLFGEFKIGKKPKEMEKKSSKLKIKKIKSKQEVRDNTSVQSPVSGGNTNGGLQSQTSVSSAISSENN